MKIKCMFCGKRLSEVGIKERLNCVCDKCLEMWEKEEARMVAKMVEYRESILERE